MRMWRDHRLLRRGFFSLFTSFSEFEFRVERARSSLLPLASFPSHDFKAFFSSTIAVEKTTFNGETPIIPTPTPILGSSSNTISFRNFLLPYPECVSADQNRGRLFISDTYHNRILITDIHGKILDSIGSSSPGFEDADFESAMMSNPAASYYSEKTDCLYFVDSQNHALRRADLEKRLVDTVHPPYVKSSSGTWNWIFGKLGFGKQVPLTTLELDSSAIESPWHVIGIEDDNFLVIDRSFEIAWVIGADDGLIKETIRGSPSIVSFCKDAIEERISLLKCLYANFTVKKGTNPLSLVSSIATVDKHAIFADTDCQRVVKYNLESKSMSCLRLSNIGVLGLPTWLICPLERVFTSGSVGKNKELVHYIKVLPGRCDIRVFVDAPGGAELLVPLDEKCIWRQVRGSGSEISVLSQGPDQTTNPEKVGVAQRWFDELDKVAKGEIAPDEREGEKEEDGIAPDERKGEEELVSENTMDKRRACFDCAVRISPGTCEVVVSTVLYLSIEGACENHEEQKVVGSRLLFNICSTSRPKELEFFFKNYEDLRDLVFACPVHLRIKLECGDYPAADTDKEIVLTDSSTSINLLL